MGTASVENLKLLRAVEKQPPLYDRGNDNYRKRLPSENSWDMVASEVGESVEKCKRRWRQLRNDYTRWCNADAHRRRIGQRRLPYPLADELRFLDRHLNLAEDISFDDERSVSSDKDRESESTGRRSQSSLKERGSLANKSVKEAKQRHQLRKEKSANEEEKTSEHNAEEEQAEEELDDAEKLPELDSYLQSDIEDDECEDEEHLENLEGFDFDLEKDSLPEKAQETENADSPASQSEFFIKESNDPHLLIIGKKNSSASIGEPEGDPLKEGMEDSGDECSGGDGEKEVTASVNNISPNRRLRRPIRSSICSAGIKELPIKKSVEGQRMTRLQRRKSLSMAALRSVNSATSPVKMAPVPRSINKPSSSNQVQIKKVNHRDDIFPRPSTAGEQNQNQNQSKAQEQKNSLIFPKADAIATIPKVPVPSPRRSVGRPSKKMHMLQGTVGPQPRPHSPVAGKLLTVNKPNSSPVNGPSNISKITNKNNIITNLSSSSSSSASTMTRVTTSNSLKPPENITVMSYSPSSTSSTSTSKTTNSPSGTVVTAIPTTSTAASSLTAPPYAALQKRTEQGIQTDRPDVFSDEHFLEMIKPQMREMNARQKLHFKKKVFQAMMETFDDATDFPTSGELQHFNINTPSGFEHVSDPELRLVRELVSMVSAAKVTITKQPKDNPIVRGPVVPSVGPRATLQRQVIQRIYKPGTGIEIASTNTPGGGQEKKMFRILQMSGKPNGNLNVSLNNLRKESVDSNHSAIRVPNNPPNASPKGATVVAAVRPQGSSINTFFGPTNATQAVRGVGPVKVRAMSRRYSVCGSGNPANPQAAVQGPANGSPLNSNMNAMEANLLKRRLIAPAQGMVPPSQRPRYSAGNVAAVPHGNSLLLRKSVGGVASNQKQISPTAVVTTPTQKTPQISSVQGAVFNDFAQPKASAAPSVSGDQGSPSSALKRSLVVANTKTSFQDLLQQPSQAVQRKKQSSETAATIAADDFSLANLKREPVDHMDDEHLDDLLGI
ncbi:mucin-5AC [Drosophila eugracilis]|uniref:mucin-5AC n=1 Tax=Drosophila eugracilis TaxID=29029 RepID=UPI0007E7887E|nr:mucin-5AC [Drosophila eugracilis]